MIPKLNFRTAALIYTTALLLSCGGTQQTPTPHQTSTQPSAGATTAASAAKTERRGSLEPLLTLSEELDLYSPQALVFDEDNIGYLLDYSACKIQVFTSDGTPIRQFGTKGEGPGEFTRPFDISYWKGRLYIYDLGLKRISCFEKDGSFLWQRKFTRTCNTAVVKNDMLHLAFYHNPGLPDIEVYPLTETGERKTAISLTAADEKTYYSLLAIADDGSIFASPINSYITQVFDTDGKPLRRIERTYEVPEYQFFPPLKLSISVVPQTRSLLFGNQFAILSGGHQRIYEQLSNTKLGPEFRTQLDVFSQDGTFLYSAWNQSLGETMYDVHSYPILAVDRDGYIWLSSLEDETKVTKFRLIAPH